ncbi:hypothetical protein CHUAL_009080 [Chamberlinius hualienensis]
MFFSTLLFQAGFVWSLVSKFRYSIFISSIYLGLSITLHSWKLILGWSDKNYIWPLGFLILFVFQRSIAVLFYHFYSQTIVHISNPKYYQRSRWSQKEFSSSK